MISVFKKKNNDKFEFFFFSQKFLIKLNAKCLYLFYYSVLFLQKVNILYIL